MRFLLLIFLGSCQCVPAVSAQDARPWSPDQAAGEPNTHEPGDKETAWAPMLPDRGQEWLKLQFPQAVEIAQVRIFETYNPGAIIRVSAYTSEKAGAILWQGKAPAKLAPQVFEIPVKENIVADNVTLLFDTQRIEGWNEIDAVELVGTDGSRQWAESATASSTYASRFPAQVYSYETLPPAVVSTHPIAGTLDVDSETITEIRVTFSKEMLTNVPLKLDIVSENHFPKLTGKLHYLADKRTCVIPVELKPDTTYVLWLNNTDSNPFQDTSNNLAVPYQLVFRTKP